MNNKTAKALLVASVSILSPAGAPSAAVPSQTAGTDLARSADLGRYRVAHLTEREIFDRAARHQSEELFRLAQVRNRDCFSQYCD